MDFEITNDRRNEFLKRREVAFTVKFNGVTPSRQQVFDKLTALLNLNQNFVVLHSLKTRFGTMKIVGIARIYDDEVTKLKLERAYLSTRGKGKERKEKEKPPKESVKPAKAEKKEEVERGQVLAQPGTIAGIQISEALDAAFLSAVGPRLGGGANIPLARPDALAWNDGLAQTGLMLPSETPTSMGHNASAANSTRHASPAHDRRLPT
jgi:small subunit ribosomal protein S24e